MKLTIIFSGLIMACALQGCGGSGNNAAPVAPVASPAPNSASANPAAAPAFGKIQDISNQELQTLLTQGVTLVDIRRPEEWKETGIVQGSQLLTLFDERGGINPEFATKIKQLAPEGKPVALICRTGNRTQIGAQMLSQVGYGQVYNVKRGITNWVAEGNPVVKP